jgi:hypothetical protein
MCVCVTGTSSFPVCQCVFLSCTIHHSFFFESAFLEKEKKLSRGEQSGFAPGGRRLPWTVGACRGLRENCRAEQSRAVQEPRCNATAAAVTNVTALYRTIHTTPASLGATPWYRLPTPRRRRRSLYCTVLYWAVQVFI